MHVGGWQGQAARQLRKWFGLVIQHFLGLLDWKTARLNGVYSKAFDVGIAITSSRQVPLNADRRIISSYFAADPVDKRKKPSMYKSTTSIMPLSP